MRPDQSTTPSLSAEEFFEAVDDLLTPPMAALGYHRLLESVNDQPESRSWNSTGVAAVAVITDEDPPFRWFELGYEAGGEAVKRLVGPEDPESQDEWWVKYEPSTGLLELDAWKPVARLPHVDWDIRADHGPCSIAEVHRRLAAVGQAVSDFVRQHGGYPVTP